MQQQEVPFLQGEFCLGWTWPPETQATKTPEMKQNFKKTKQLNNCKKSNLNWQKGWGGKKGKIQRILVVELHCFGSRLSQVFEK